MRRGGGGVLFGAVLAAALAGCGSQEPSGPDPGQLARERVQTYLDAMKAKDVAAGRAQLCAGMHATFDRIATGPNGDFAAHFVVTDATVTGGQAVGADQRVDAAVMVTAAGDPRLVGLVFTLSHVDGHWCIADEETGPPPTAYPSPSPDGTASPSPSPDGPSPSAAPAGPGAVPSPR
ncbi:hypothetical protein [Polymorphospora lycopeni]|uniref:Nuclear transport factor 2 family protein n=1 Tax=Polymorphospora lycopeni TaxID=3140240 RepID=A0ABV5CUW0_9ACTN